jgi:LysM repeat protein
MPTWAWNTRPVTKPELVGELFDTGPREYATGQPTRKAGKIVAYTVQPGDALQAIAKRFCINADTFGLFNHTFGYDLQPGDVLVLRPDPTVPWYPKD